MKCKNCGKKLDENSRCCLFCGTINMEEEKNSEIISELMLNSKNYLDEDKFTASKPMIILNVIVIILLACISIFISNILTVFLIFILYFYVICFEFIFKKANLPWYGAFIPVYNLFLIYEISFGIHTGNKKFLTLINIVLYTIYLAPSYKMMISDESIPEIVAVIIVYAITIIFSILYTVILFKLSQSFAKKFDQVGVFVFLFPFIMVPYIAFNKNIVYNNDDDVILMYKK